MRAPDIVDVLRAASEMADELTPDESAHLFKDAAQMIESLRKLVGVQNELLDGDPRDQESGPH